MPLHKTLLTELRWNLVYFVASEIRAQSFHNGNPVKGDAHAYLHDAEEVINAMSNLALIELIERYATESLSDVEH